MTSKVGMPSAIKAKQRAKTKLTNVRGMKITLQSFSVDGFRGIEMEMVLEVNTMMTKRANTMSSKVNCPACKKFSSPCQLNRKNVASGVVAS